MPESDGIFKLRNQRDRFISDSGLLTGYWRRIMPQRSFNVISTKLIPDFHSSIYHLSCESKQSPVNRSYWIFASFPRSISRIFVNFDSRTLTLSLKKSGYYPVVYVVLFFLSKPISLGSFTDRILISTHMVSFPVISGRSAVEVDQLKKPTLICPKLQTSLLRQNQ